MKPVRLSILVLSTLLICLCPSIAAPRSNFDIESPLPTEKSSTELPLIGADELRHAAVHNAGDFYTPIMNGIISFGNLFYSAIDPESGDVLELTTYPQSQQKRYVWSGAVWVGGIVDQDTLVSVAFDGWYRMMELRAENYAEGGVRRIGHYADDEFITTLADTAIPGGSPFPHTPLGIQVEQISYSWADTAYDDYVILEHTIRNIGGNHIREGWIGLYIDCDIFYQDNLMTGYSDDYSASLDTLLYDGDPSSRRFITYSYDNDGDPSGEGQWSDSSITGAMSIMLLNSSFPVDHYNFNYWFSSGSEQLDWGPRRLGTPQDPLRYFNDGNLGTPVTDVDKYYIMSHPEVDYDQIEVMIHDSADGWVPPTGGNGSDFVDGYDTRHLYSFGPFDLPPDDSVTFALALVGADGLHANATDYADAFDPMLPQFFRETLDFSNLVANCRRVDSVYQSGYKLPHPGPPVGLEVTDFDDSFIDISWKPSSRSDLAGYYIYLKDTVYGGVYNRVSGLVTDTMGTVSVYEPNHTYYVAVSLADTLGRESGVSLPVSVIPGSPHPPQDLSISLDGIIPHLTWTPHDDTAIQAFMIYRGEWNDPVELYDSTAALHYRDYGVESGVRYSYKISTKNILDLQSELVGPLTALPMKLEPKILYCNLNRYPIVSPPPYPIEYLHRLYESVACFRQIDILNIDEGEIPFKTLSEYSHIIVDEGNIPRTMPMHSDSLANYLAGGGRAVIIKPALGTIGAIVKTDYYGPGSFYHDIMKLDSATVNAFVLVDQTIMGDLKACNTLKPEYPQLYADTNKIAGSPLPLAEYIPLSGYFFPGPEAEPIYSYASSNPDTAHHGCINGIRYLGEDYGFVMLGFPLMAMEEQESFYALRRALKDLGVDMACGDANNDGRADIGDAYSLIAYLYRGGPAPPSPKNADSNCSGHIDVADVISLINFIFKSGRLECCW